MALRTDDCDINDTYLQTLLGGNGDYYIIIYDRKDGTSKSVRIATSGGQAPVEVKVAAANLYRAMEAAELNEHPK